MFFDHLPQHGLICGHRGARSIAPENTLLSMIKAREYGAHCWETEVRTSKDGELVVFHDATLERTTDITTHRTFQRRQDYHVDQFTVDELRDLDSGSWFLTDDPFGTVASGDVAASECETIQNQQIPLLREVLNYSRTRSFPVNIEIKSLDTAVGDTVIVDSVIELIRETGTMDLVLLSSFRHEYLHRARTLNQEVSLAVLAEKEHPADLIHYLKSFSAVAYHPDEAICDDELITQLDRAGFRVNSWTVNDMKRAKEMHRLGAGVITDWPQHLAC